METKDKTVFLAVLNRTAIIYEKQFNEEMISAYWDLLKEFSLEAITEAFNQHCRQSQFFPKPAEIIGIIEGNTGDIAMVEAAKVIQAIKQYGAYQSVVFDDEVTQAVIHYGFGGWIQLCDLESKNEKWFIKDFCVIYGSYKRSGIHYFGKLLGTYDQLNDQHGFKERIKPPILIGNEQRALRILATENENILNIAQELKEDVKGLIEKIKDV